jgi:hypothetical protein
MDDGVGLMGVGGGEAVANGIDDRFGSGGGSGGSGAGEMVHQPYMQQE